ncbi:MAG: hypothetical protein ABIH41_05670 [Nanoarchaeota archaeon]
MMFQIVFVVLVLTVGFTSGIVMIFTGIRRRSKGEDPVKDLDFLRRRMLGFVEGLSPDEVKDRTIQALRRQWWP